MATKEENKWAAIMHLSVFTGFVVPVAGFLAPFAIWLAKKNESEYLDKVGKEILNFLISMICAGAIAGLLCLVLIGFPILALLGVACIVLPIMAAVKCSDGEFYEYPFIWRPIK